MPFAAAGESLSPPSMRAECLAVLPGAMDNGRGSRLAARLRGDPLPRFEDLAGIARWRLLPTDRIDDLAIAAALLFHRPQIDRSVDGARLRTFAHRFGEALFDAACDARTNDLATSAGSQLPHANHLRDVGLSLIRRGVDDREPGVVRLLDRAAALIADAPEIGDAPGDGPA